MPTIKEIAQSLDSALVESGHNPSMLHTGGLTGESARNRMVHEKVRRVAGRVLRENGWNFEPPPSAHHPINFTFPQTQVIFFAMSACLIDEPENPHRFTGRGMRRIGIDESVLQQAEENLSTLQVS